MFNFKPGRTARLFAYGHTPVRPSQTQGLCQHHNRTRPAFLAMTAVLLAGSAAAELADPMRPAGWQPAPKPRPALKAPVRRAAPVRVPHWHLQGVVDGPDGRRALIDGEWRAVGSAINGAKIMAIGNQAVQLHWRGRPLQLTLNSSIDGTGSADINVRSLADSGVTVR